MGGFESVDHMQAVFNIRHKLIKMGQARVIFNSRSSYSIANALAKNGSGGGEKVVS